MPPLPTLTGKQVGGVARKSVKVELRVWYDAKSRQIKLAGEALTASTVSNDPSSMRCHPNLYLELTKLLRQAGVPTPAVEKNR